MTTKAFMADCKSSSLEAYLLMVIVLDVVMVNMMVIVLNMIVIMEIVMDVVVMVNIMNMIHMMVVVLGGKIVFTDRLQKRPRRRTLAKLIATKKRKRRCIVFSIYHF